MYSTRTRVHARIPNGHPREEKRAYRTKVRGQVGKDRRGCPARGELNGPRALRQADFRARRGTPRRLPRTPDTPTSREDPCAEVGEEVRVGVGVRVRIGPMEFKLKRSIVFRVQLLSVCRGVGLSVCPVDCGYQTNLVYQLPCRRCSVTSTCDLPASVFPAFWHVKK